MQFIILGCGSSMGVPRPDGFFGNCDPNNKKNYRTRCSALIKTTDENILIDTSPDLRQQLLRHKINKINKVLYSHMHGDQTHGINDLRSFYINSRKQLDVYADKYTSKYLKNTFSYIFKSYSKEYPATLKLNKLPNYIFSTNNKKKVSIRSIIVEHGKVKSNCFIINKKLAYISDVSKIYRKDFKYDLIIPIKYNWQGKNLGKGSCIFLHLTKNYKPTAGCIGLSEKDFLIILKLINRKTNIQIL